MTIIDQYFDYQEKFEKKYGEKTIVLMEVGSFFEIYGVTNNKMNIYALWCPGVVSYRRKCK